MSQAAAAGAAAPRRVFVVGVGMTKFEKVSQRVLNDLKRARLSLGRMIRLLAHPGRQNRRNKWLFPMEFWLFSGTENYRNSVPNPSAEKTT